MNRYRLAPWIMLPATLGILPFAGCTPDDQHRDIPAPEVKPVTAYGLTLDTRATPQQVAYAFLRSIADDVKAAQAHQSDEQKAAMRTTHSLLAYAVIEQRLEDAEKLAQVKKKATTEAERAEKLWNYSRQLAPIVAHYVPSFDPTFEAAVSKMRLLGTLETGVLHIYYQAAHDPDAADVEKRDPVIIDIELSQEKKGGETYWRVAKVAFAGAGASISSPRAVVPTTNVTAGVPGATASQPAASAPSN